MFSFIYRFGSNHNNKVFNLWKLMSSSLKLSKYSIKNWKFARNKFSIKKISIKLGRKNFCGWSTLKRYAWSLLAVTTVMLYSSVVALVSAFHSWKNSEYYYLHDVFWSKNSIQFLIFKIIFKFFQWIFFEKLCWVLLITHRKIVFLNEAFWLLNEIIQVFLRVFHVHESSTGYEVVREENQQEKWCVNR